MGIRKISESELLKLITAEELARNHHNQNGIVAAITYKKNSSGVEYYIMTESNEKRNQSPLTRELIADEYELD